MQTDLDKDAFLRLLHDAMNWCLHQMAEDPSTIVKLEANKRMQFYEQIERNI